jgi:hypothetical protein
VVHRDLKPANILAWEEGGVRRVKVIDFGVARALEEPLSDLAVTAVRQLVGTPGYMSPEQAEPGSADIDVRSDVYSLGVVLYEVLAGRLPFASAGRRGAGVEVPGWPEGGVMGGAPRAWRRDLLAIAGRAMAMSPGGRYASAEALADDLQRVLDEQPVSARPARGIEVLGKLARRHRAAVVLGMLAVVSLVAGMAASLVMYWRAETRAEDLRRARAREDVQTAQRWKAERQFHGAMPVLARALETEPDAVAAASVLERLRMPKRIVTVLSGESLVNDASGLVLYRFAVAAAMTGVFDPVVATGAFLAVSTGGIVVGLVAGWGLSWLSARLHDTHLETAASFLAAWGSYILAEQLQVSGVLATVACGVWFGWRRHEVLRARSV